MLHVEKYSLSTLLLQGFERTCALLRCRAVILPRAVAESLSSPMSEVLLPGVMAESLPRTTTEIFPDAMIEPLPCTMTWDLIYEPGCFSRYDVHFVFVSLSIWSRRNLLDIGTSILHCCIICPRLNALISVVYRHYHFFSYSMLSLVGFFEASQLLLPCACSLVCISPIGIAYSNLILRKEQVVQNSHTSSRTGN